MNFKNQAFKFFILFFIFLSCLFFLSHGAFAKPETSAVMSNKCDEAKIRVLAGDALIKLEPQTWGDVKGFLVTLETDKMTFAQLTQKMQKEGCF